MKKEIFPSRSWIRSTAFALATLSASVVAQASTIYASLAVINPTGVVHSSDTVEVWARLSLATNSAPLHYNRTEPNAGLLPALGPLRVWDQATQKMVDVASLSNAGGIAYSGGPNPFANSNYTWDWGSSNPASWYRQVVDGVFDLVAGQSIDVLVGTLTPRTGFTGSGNLSYSVSGLGVTADVTTTSGVTLADRQTIWFAECLFTCDSRLTRTVVGATAVPEPASAALLPWLALGATSAWRRRRRMATPA